MTVAKKDVENIATLARLEFTDEELDQLTQQLGSILDYASQLNELDTDGVKPSPHGVLGSNVFREDVVEPSLSLDQALGNAPDQEDGCFKVPKIIE
jgi:aspartyl-tRNA(Asn)/glutamyl-tRNA(Gln) amidotransferase subunit C